MARQNKAQMYRTLIYLILIMLFVYVCYVVFTNIKKSTLG